MTLRPGQMRAVLETLYRGKVVRYTFADSQNWCLTFRDAGVVQAELSGVVVRRVLGANPKAKRRRAA